MALQIHRTYFWKYWPEEFLMFFNLLRLTKAIFMHPITAEVFSRLKLDQTDNGLEEAGKARLVNSVYFNIKRMSDIMPK